MATKDPTEAYRDNDYYMSRENEYMNSHPIGNAKLPRGLHISPNHEHLANEHGGIRTASHVRQDIRTGYEMARNSDKPTNMVQAENMGYEARKHLYIDAEQNAKKGK